MAQKQTDVEEYVKQPDASEEFVKSLIQKKEETTHDKKNKTHNHNSRGYVVLHLMLHR